MRGFAQDRLDGRLRRRPPARRPRSPRCRGPTPRLPAFSASAISESVPYPPPTAISASAARTTSALRASPRPVGIATSTNSFAAPRSVPGRIPTVVPPPLLRAPAGGLHHAAETAADEHRSARGQQPPDRLGGGEVAAVTRAGDGDRRSGPRRRLVRDRRRLVHAPRGRRLRAGRRRLGRGGAAAAARAAPRRSPAGPSTARPRPPSARRRASAEPDAHVLVAAVVTGDRGRVVHDLAQDDEQRQDRDRERHARVERRAPGASPPPGRRASRARGPPAAGR